MKWYDCLGKKYFKSHSDKDNICCWNYTGHYCQDSWQSPLVYVIAWCRWHGKPLPGPEMLEDQWNHYSHVTWASCHHKSLVTQLFVQQLIQPISGFHYNVCLAYYKLKFNICIRFDMAFIAPMHHNKPNITYLFRLSHQSSAFYCPFVRGNPLRGFPPTKCQ